VIALAAVAPGRELREMAKPRERVEREPTGVRPAETYAAACARVSRERRIPLDAARVEVDRILRGEAPAGSAGNAPAPAVVTASDRDPEAQSFTALTRKLMSEKKCSVAEAQVAAAEAIRARTAAIAASPHYPFRDAESKRNWERLNSPGARTMRDAPGCECEDLHHTDGSPTVASVCR
jgi:hypothetical protein